MRTHTLLVAATVLALTATLHAQVQSDSTDSSPWRFALQGEYWYGHISGYTQTPAGGQPGTSSSHRPTFGEMGIHDTSVYDVGFNAAWHNEEVQIAGQFIRPSGSDTLSSDLESHGKFFAAGTQVSSDVQLDWYRLAYRHRFDIPQWNLTLRPSVGAAFWAFDYHLSGGGASASRSYIKVAPQAGIDAEWRPGNGPFSIDLNLIGSLPITPPLPQIHVEELTGGYRLVHKGKLDVSARAGVAFEQIRYEDDQTLPNHIKADLGPMIVVGFEVDF